MRCSHPARRAEAAGGTRALARAPGRHGSPVLGSSSQGALGSPGGALCPAQLLTFPAPLAPGGHVAQGWHCSVVGSRCLHLEDAPAPQVQPAAGSVRASLGLGEQAGAWSLRAMLACAPATS